MDKIHKLLTGFCLIKGSAEVTGSGNSILFLYAAHLHAHVSCFHDDHDAERVKRLLNALLDLQGHAFLHLQTVRVDIDDACYLAEPGDVAIGYVGYMCFAVEGQHVMLAK